MAQKKNPNLRLMKPLNLEEMKKKAGQYRRSRAKKWLTGIVLGSMMIFGTGMLIVNHPYDTVYSTSSYKRETADSNQYAAFGKGIVRYSRDGITYLTRKNEERWIWPSQFKNPEIDIQKNVFAVGDIGGNAIQVFTEDGVKGEIETTLPIEMFSVSDQGIVSAVLKNENAPMIVTYDAAGNILVENQVSASGNGYPTALEMSPDGTVLMVSSLSSEGGALKSKVVCYNFGETGKKESDRQTGSEEYADVIIPEIYFMGASRAVAVSDKSFVVYEGGQNLKKKTEIQIGQEIKSSFHTDQYIGFVLLNKDKSGYEVRLYNKNGKMLMNRELTGEYSNVQMVGNEIILYEGSKCCIITSTGVPRFKGDLKVDALAVIPVNGFNKYLVMSANELRVIHLAI